MKKFMNWIAMIRIFAVALLFFFLFIYSIVTIKFPFPIIFFAILSATIITYSVLLFKSYLKINSDNGKKFIKLSKIDLYINYIILLVVIMIFIGGIIVYGVDIFSVKLYIVILIVCCINSLLAIILSSLVINKKVG